MLSNSDNKSHVVYNNFKYILAGCNTYEDALYLCNNAKLNKIEHTIVMSIINSQKFNNLLIDNITFISLISNITTYKYKEDVHDAIEDIKKKLDNTHVKTLMRIADKKQCRPEFIKSKESREKIVKNDDSIKKCPHCNHLNVFSKNSKYVICGYPENGHDWTGCGKDWCFACEKMLCKSWNDKQLSMPLNRTHNDICCKTHAEQHNLNYEKMYCQCANENVNRNYESK